MQRRRRAGHTFWARFMGAAAVLMATVAGAHPAFAAGSWTTTAVGPAVAESAVVPMGKLPTATILQGSVKLEWAPSTYPSGKEVGGYIVRRQVIGGTDVVNVCTVAAPSRTCQDSPTAGQQVVYTVVPSEQLWRGPASPPSAPVTLPAPTLGVATTVPSPSPSASASPTPSPTPTPLPTATPSPTASPTPAATPTSTPTPSPS